MRLDLGPIGVRLYFKFLCWFARFINDSADKFERRRIKGNILVTFRKIDRFFGPTLLGEPDPAVDIIVREQFKTTFLVGGRGQIEDAPLF